MTILDAITSSPINVFFTIVIGLGLAYLYYRKPSSSSSSGSQSSSSNHRRHYPTSAFLNTHPASGRPGAGLDAGLGVVDEELQRSLALIERQERDMIRQEQDAAYYQSLKADREKILKKEEERRDREAKEKAERDEKERLERLHQRLTKLKSEIGSKLPNEGTTGAGSDANNIVKLVFKLPDGTRIKRDFCKHDKVKYLHWFVFGLANAPLQFRMTTNFPKRELPGRPPVPEDFQDEEQEESNFETTTTTNDSSSAPTTPSTAPDTTTTSTSRNSNNTSTISNHTVEPNCELTLAEAGLTETQIIFVYDLEA